MRGVKNHPYRYLGGEAFRTSPKIHYWRWFRSHLKLPLKSHTFNVDAFGGGFVKTDSNDKTTPKKSFLGVEHKPL